MKILHCADLHLDAPMNTYLSREQSAERRDELLANYNRLMEFAAAQGVGAILIAGDLFDVGKPRKRAVDMVRRSVLDNRGIDFYYLKGNHDAADILPEKERPANFHVFSDTWTRYELLRNGSRALVLYGAELGAVPARDLFAALRPEEQNVNIVTLHGQLTEYGGGTAETIELSRLRGKNIDYLALGHVHAHTVGTLAPRGVYVYPGCLEGRGFDECGEHGFELLEVNEASLQISHRFVPFARRHFFDLAMDITGASETAGLYAPAKAILEESGAGRRDIVRLRLTGAVGENAEIAPGALQRAYASQYYYFTVEDRTATAVDYGSYAADASLRGEFVRLVGAAQDLDEKTKAEVIRCGLRGLRGEELLEEYP